MKQLKLLEKAIQVLTDSKQFNANQLAVLVASLYFGLDKHGEEYMSHLGNVFSKLLDN